MRHVEGQKRFDIQGGAALDLASGLMWLLCANPAGWPMFFSEALTYVDGLNASKHQGFSDWRLPKPPRDFLHPGPRPGQPGAHRRAPLHRRGAGLVLVLHLIRRRSGLCLVCAHRGRPHVLWRQKPLLFHLAGKGDGQFGRDRAAQVLHRQRRAPGPASEAARTARYRPDGAGRPPASARGAWWCSTT